MYSQVKSSDKTERYVVELVVDSGTDIDTLPTHYAPGSTCIVANESRVFILNNSKEWVEL